MTVVKLIEKSDNCKHWTAEDAIADAVKEMDGLDVRECLVLWYETLPDGSRISRYRVSGLDREQHIAMLNIYLKKAIDGFLNGE